MLGWLADKVRSSLVVRFALLTGGLLSLAATMTGIIIFTAGRQLLQDQIRSSLTGMASARAAEIAGIVEQDYERTALIASRTRLRECLVNVVKGVDVEANRAQMKRILTDAIESVDAIHYAAVLDTHCSLVVETGEHAGLSARSPEALCRAGREGFIHGDWHLQDGLLHCDVYGPLMNPLSEEDEVIGVIRTTFGLSRILHILADYTGLGDTGELVLGLQEGGRIGYRSEVDAWSLSRQKISSSRTEYEHSTANTEHPTKQCAR